MKKLFFLLFLLGLAIPATQVFAQENVQFARGAREKTVPVTLAAGASKTYAIQARANQAILVTPKGANASQAEMMLVNDNNVADYETRDGSLRILTENNGRFLIRITNTSSTRKTFNINFFVDSGKFY